jgi:hypothetical protein
VIPNQRFPLSRFVLHFTYSLLFVPFYSTISLSVLNTDNKGNHVYFKYRLLEWNHKQQSSPCQRSLCDSQSETSDQWNN